MRTCNELVPACATDLKCELYLCESRYRGEELEEAPGDVLRPLLPPAEVLPHRVHHEVLDHGREALVPEQHHVFLNSLLNRFHFTLE